MSTTLPRLLTSNEIDELVRRASGKDTYPITDRVLATLVAQRDEIARGVALRDAVLVWVRAMGVPSHTALAEEMGIVVALKGWCDDTVARANFADGLTDG